MTRLTLGARNLLVQAPEVKALITAGLLGGGPTFRTWKDGWVFADMPYANIESRSHTALVVITDGGGWQGPDPTGTSRFPRLLVDIWASPTRDEDDCTSIQVQDADILIEDVFAAMRPYLHTVNLGVPVTATPAQAWLGAPGYPRVWGTAAQIAGHTGVTVLSSEQLGEPDFNDVRDGNGARMGRYAFGLHIA